GSPLRQLQALPGDGRCHREDSARSRHHTRSRTAALREQTQRADVLTSMRHIALGLAIFTAALAPFGICQTAAKPAAHWEGKIQIPEHELGLTVDLAQDAKGLWIGSITVVGSTSIDVPLTEVVVDG